MMEVIDVKLYGGKSIFGGKETPLEANIISCNMQNECSYFQNKQCLRVRTFGSTGCKYGKSESVTGYTSRAKKYYDFKKKWGNHEKYKAGLSHPPDKIGEVADYIVFPYPHIRFEVNEKGISIGDPSFSNGSRFISKEKFTNEFIYRICTFRPHAMMGGEIKSYQNEVVPLFLSHLKTELPDKYKSLIEEYPEFNKEIDYVGRTALLNTINPCMVHYKSRQYPSLNEEWEWNGEYLTYKSGYVSKVNITKDYEVCEYKIKPSDKSTIKISNNDQVNKNTVFID